MDKKREKYIMENEKNEMKKKPGKLSNWIKTGKSSWNRIWPRVQESFLPE